MRPDDLVLVNGGSGVTGTLLVGLAAARGAEVIATAGPASHERLRRLGAAHVLDYHDPDWPEQARAIGGGLGVTAVANAVPNGSADAIGTVRDGGHLATITQDPPDEQRGIEISSVIVQPDGRALGELAELLDGREARGLGPRRRSRSRMPPRPSRQQPGAAPAERSCFAPDGGEDLARSGIEWRPPLVNDGPVTVLIATKAHNRRRVPIPAALRALLAAELLRSGQPRRRAALRESLRLALPACS